MTKKITSPIYGNTNAWRATFTNVGSAIKIEKWCMDKNKGTLYLTKECLLVYALEELKPLIGEIQYDAVIEKLTQK